MALVKTEIIFKGQLTSISLYIFGLNTIILLMISEFYKNILVRAKFLKNIKKMKKLHHAF